MFFSQLRSGAEHVLGGWDHLLFLLVVLSVTLGSGFNWRNLLLTLTCFTLGHALTLAGVSFGGVTVSPALVEPAIELTFLLLALLDLVYQRRARVLSRRTQLALVFGCALIHGLGLASALSQMGLDRQHLVPSLAGFNLGIEAAQVAVSAAAGGLYLVLRAVNP